MRSFNTRTCWLCAGVLTLSILLASSPVLGAQNAENPEVTRLLEQARDKAAELSRDADDMEAMTRSDVSWQSHAMMLDQIKDHVNDMGKIVERLTAMRSSASSWQQQAIDRMLPLMRDIATNTTAAINHLKENQIRPVSGDYTQYLEENANTSHQLASMVSSFVEYGQGRARLEKLEHQLEIASK